MNSLIDSVSNFDGFGNAYVKKEASFAKLNASAVEDGAPSDGESKERYALVRRALAQNFETQQESIKENSISSSALRGLPEPKTLLEVYSSNQAKMAVFFVTFMSIFGFIVAVTFAVLRHTVGVDFITVQTSPNTTSELAFMQADGAIVWVNISIWVIEVLILICTLIIFGIHIRHRTTDLVSEQIHLFLLALFTMIYITPYTDLMFVITGLTTKEALQSIIANQMSFFSIPVIVINVVSSMLCYLGFLFSIMMYIIVASRSYRNLDAAFSASVFVSDKRLLLGTGFLFLSYMAIRLLALFGPRVIYSGSIFSTLISALRIEWHPGIRLRWNWGFLVAHQFLDFILIGWIVSSLIKTRNILGSRSYLKYRNSQLGFNLFLFETSIMLFFQIVSEIFEVFLVQIGQFAMLYEHSGLLVLYYSTSVAGRSIGLVSYVLLRMYSNLPADVTSVFNLKKRSKITPNLDYKRAAFQISHLDSVDDNGSLKLVERNFTLQTQVLMLNFAYLSYRLFIEGEEERMPDYYGDHEHKIVQKIQEDLCDTHAIIAESEERIIVAFRGTVSKKNVESDINIKAVKMDVLFPEPLEGRMMEHLEWSEGKVHKGFAESYMAIRDRIEDIVVELFHQKSRIVYICGHSLGGALATLFSFGLSVKHGRIREKGILVTTFGSPRVGNLLFGLLYREYISICWRIVNSGDMVTKIPARPYKHVGTTVLLTTDCEMFVDPMFAEKLAFHKTKQQFVTHRLPTYYLSLRYYVEHHHGKIIARRVGFWDWTLDHKVKRMYQHNLSKKKSLGAPGTSRSNTLAMTRGVQSWRNLVELMVLKGLI